MAEISFHDINCELGRRTAPRLEQRLTTEEVSLALNYAGIERALAYHAMAKEYDPREGNDALVEIVRDNRIFEPCFVILPEATGEFPYGDALIRYLADGGAAAVRLFPKSHGYGLGQTWCSTMFGALAEKGVPVLIELAESSWDEIDGVLTHNPRLNLVVVRAGYRN
ncbi:MAG: hypothetical protein QGH20_02760, partial [Candidatus Latescibacteria bacterium]|nr:hypothetical protein [Candidatus Latescibacterota bacterium]